MRLAISVLVLAGLVRALSAVEVAEPGEAARASLVARVLAAPTVVAAQERWLATRRRRDAAGRLADPVVGLGLARKHNLGERYPMWEVGIEQDLPRWGERDAARSAAAAEAALAEGEMGEVSGQLAADTAGALAVAAAAHATMELLVTQLARATALESTVAARVATGSAALADRLALASAVGSLQLERERAVAAEVDAEAEVRTLLGLPAAEPLPPFAAPVAAAVGAARAPATRRALARASQADARVAAARSQGQPQTAVGIRFQREAPDQGDEDTLGVELRVALPVHRQALAAELDAARGERRAAERDALVASLRVETMLARAERAGRIAERARALAEADRARLAANYTALLGAVGADGEVGIIAVLGVLDRITASERQVIAAEAERRRALADLWRLAPPVPGAP